MVFEWVLPPLERVLVVSERAGVVFEWVFPPLERVFVVSERAGVTQ